MIPYPEVEPADGARADDGPVTSDHRPYPLQSPGGPGGSAPALVIDYSPASSSSGPFDSGTTDQRYPSQSYGTHVVATRARGGSPDGPPGPVHSARDRRSSTRGPTPTMSRRAMSPTPPTTLPARPPAPAPPHHRSISPSRPHRPSNVVEGATGAADGVVLGVADSEGEQTLPRGDAGGLNPAGGQRVLVPPARRDGRCARRPDSCGEAPARRRWPPGACAEAGGRPRYGPRDRRRRAPG